MQEPENQADHDADQNARCNREIEVEVFPFNHDIAGQVEQTESGEPRPGNAGNDQQQTNDDQCAGHGGRP